MWIPTTPVTPDNIRHARKLAMDKLDVDINDGHHATKPAMGKLDVDTNDARHARKHPSRQKTSHG